MNALLAKIADRVARADADYEAWERRQQRARRVRPHEAFLRSAAWLVAREQCLAEKGRICVKCGAGERINVDHILPRYRFPELALAQANLRPLCWPCNRAKGTSIESA